MYLKEGTLLQGGKYKIVRHISSGGFDNTYEALDVNLDKKVAIKEFFVKDFCSRETEEDVVNFPFFVVCEYNVNKIESYKISVSSSCINDKNTGITSFISDKIIIFASKM